MSTRPEPVTNYVPNPSFEVDTGLVTTGAGVTVSTGPPPASGAAALILAGTTPAQVEANSWAGQAVYANAQPGTELTFRGSATGDAGLFARLALHWRAGTTILFDTFGPRIALGATPVPLEHTSAAIPGADNVHARIYISGSASGATPPASWLASTDAWILLRDGGAPLGPTLEQYDAVWAGATLADRDTYWASSTLAAFDLDPLARS